MGVRAGVPSVEADELAARRGVTGRHVRRIIVADEIKKIHQHSRGAYGKRRIRAALLEEHEMIVNHKLVAAIMRERRSGGRTRPGQRPARIRPHRTGSGWCRGPESVRGCGGEVTVDQIRCRRMPWILSR
ncbi:IS3 family transposase [Polymorphospora sp. NPDC051019]|uniref:IS3 family transposase n=1 Tax=Polymorphospora sp. NPDC051019 TaxID=3155725 RepID=UPI00344AAA3E